MDSNQRVAFGTLRHPACRWCLLALVGLLATGGPSAAQGEFNFGPGTINQIFEQATLKPSYRALAAYWAPVVSQDMDSDNYRAEYITRFDYDGDWKADNNWNNLYRFPLPGAVYYWVSETATHYFIGYAFFHPRDWNDGPGGFAGAGGHENDLEAILLTIKKQGTYGQFVAMVTVAHSDFYSFTDQDTPSWSPWYAQVAPSQIVRSGAESIDGDVDFVADYWGLHPVVYVEAKGHGVYAVRSRVSDSPWIFDLNRVIDWRNVNWRGLPSPPAVIGSAAQIFWDDGILYHYEGVADAPVGVSSQNGGPHNWQIVGYDLVSIQEMWQRRNNPETFADYGVFRGDEGKDNAALAPWAWDDHDEPLDAGALFNDSARLVAHYFDGLSVFSFIYTGRSYQ